MVEQVIPKLRFGTCSPRALPRGKGGFTPAGCDRLPECSSPFEKGGRTPSLNFPLAAVEAREEGLSPSSTEVAYPVSLRQGAGGCICLAANLHRQVCPPDFVPAPCDTPVRRVIHLSYCRPTLVPEVAPRVVAAGGIDILPAPTLQADRSPGYNGYPTDWGARPLFRRRSHRTPGEASCQGNRGIPEHSEDMPRKSLYCAARTDGDQRHKLRSGARGGQPRISEGHILRI